MKNSGLATVVVATSTDVALACRELDGKLLYNRPMIVRKDKFVEDELGYTPAPTTAPKADGRGVEVA
jgi:RNA recognition motif-containing protein